MIPGLATGTSEAVGEPVTPEEIVRALHKHPELAKGVRRLLEKPETVGQLLDQAMVLLPLSQLAKMKAEDKKDLVRYHHGFGQGLRNHFRLWDDEQQGLVVELCEGRQEIHVDESSMAIMEAMWERTQTMEFDPSKS